MNDYESIAIAKAKQIKEQLGGMIFAFPVEEDNPFSAYAVVMCVGGQYFVYPKAADISEASVGVLTVLDELKKRHMATDYSKDVRFISCQAQMDAPSVTMRRLKKANISNPVMEKEKDFADGEGKDNLLLSMRGVIKISYLSVINDDNEPAKRFMQEYYKLLAMHRYGKTAAAIKQEVRRMTKDQAIRWIEQTYERYIQDSQEIVDIFSKVARE